MRTASTPQNAKVSLHGCDNKTLILFIYKKRNANWINLALILFSLQIIIVFIIILKKG